MAAMEEGMMVVERVVVCGSRVCMEEKDVKEGLFLVTNLDEAANVLVPRTPERLRELVGYTFFKPPPLGWLASCFLLDFIFLLFFFAFFQLCLLKFCITYH